MNCSYPAFEEAPILLPQPVPVTGDAPGAPLSRSDQVRQAARARNTQRAYLGHWTRFHSWAQEQGLDLPGDLGAALCDYLVRLAEDGKRMATIRQARAAIIRGAELVGWPKPGGPGVAEMMRGLGRILRGAQRQAPLHAEALAAIRATAFTRRRTRGGHTETAEYARRRGLVDVALASVMRDGLPGTGKTHALCAVGHRLVESGRSVLFAPAYRLVQDLLAAKRDLALPRQLRKLDSYDFLLLDDLGYLPQGAEESEVLFTLIAERYERRSLGITSNLVFSQWEHIFANPMATAAAIDRVVHHSVILEFDVPSYRTGVAQQRGQDKEVNRQE